MESNQKILLEKVENALDTVRPHLETDGGDVEVVGITDDDTLLVKWLGNCSNCNMSVMTLKAGIEQTIISKVPQIKSVRAVNGLSEAY